MKKLRFDLFAVEVRDQNGSRVAAVSLTEGEVQVFADAFNKLNERGALAIVHPISAAIDIAKPKSRSA